MSKTKTRKPKTTLVLKVVTYTNSSLYARGQLCHLYEVGSTHTAPKGLPLYVYPKLSDTFPGEYTSLGRKLLLCEVTGKLVRVSERLDIDVLKQCKAARKALRLLSEGHDSLGVGDEVRGATQLRVLGVVDRERSTIETLVLTDGREFEVTFKA